MGRLKEERLLTFFVLRVLMNFTIGRVFREGPEEVVDRIFIRFLTFYGSSPSDHGSTGCVVQYVDV